MKKKKLHCTFFLTLTPDLRKFLRSRLRGYTANIYTEQLTTEKLDKKTEVLGVFVDSKIPKEVFSKLPKLKLIVTLSTGFDHIDVKEAKRRGVVVCNVPTYGEETVAEHALMLILSLAKNLFQAAKRVKEGNYDYHGLRGFDIEGKTIGVIGTGHIGMRLIQLLSGFDVTIVAYDKFKKPDMAKKLNFQYVSKAKLFHTSDIISLHLPLLKQTHHIIDKNAIKQMRKGVHIVNTARGGLIDSEALVWGLETGAVAGAGIDVLDHENLIEDPLLLCDPHCTPEDKFITLMNNVLIDHPKTIVTPHTAFNTIEAVKRIISTSADNIDAFATSAPQNTV